MADTEAEQFEKTVSEYAAIVGTDADVTRDSSYHAEGKTLSGLGNDGRLHQTIIITSAICRQAIMEVAFMLGYLNMDEKTIHEKQLEQLYSVHLIVPHILWNMQKIGLPLGHTSMNNLFRRCCDRQPNFLFYRNPFCVQYLTQAKMQHQDRKRRFKNEHKRYTSSAFR